ncbi:GTP pyrophosphokinase [Corynebacterium aquilae]|uniref:GTP pyrophosphokinase n=1 Tax=Corynebacterium aquilae DSM 44791 TaxID=1431546 RepID=A0A1L7CGU8_9CORY|nr:GTP pyrophosphokinase [Corynebacterium aquilae]APT85066.1 GTP pyrophosphokinase [Corynebacterium aquilae DSM 44791]
MPHKKIPALKASYNEFRRTYPLAADDFVDAIEELLSDAGVNYDRVTARVKQWRSLKAKALKKGADGHPLYGDPWHEIVDIVGVRVTTYNSTAIPDVIGVLKKSFAVKKQVDKAAQTRISGGFGYGSHHLVLQVTEACEDLQDYLGLVFEVQVRTVLQHAWAEFEHDIRYKGAGGEFDPRVDRAFTLAAGLIELADQQFDQIAAIQQEVPAGSKDVELSADTLPGILTMLNGTRFPRAKTEYYPWMEDLLISNGVTTVADLKKLLNEADISAVESSMKYRFPPSQLRIIDDLLLRKFGTAYIERTKDTGNRASQRAGRLRKRLKIMQAAGVLDSDK